MPNDYGYTHRKLRKHWARRIANGEHPPCARGCGRTIGPDDAWHLDHTDDGTAYLGPSCAHCNTSAAGRKAHRMGKGLDPDGDESKADRQACSCRFCLRAIALWHLGYRRTGMSYREKKQARKERARDPRVRV